MKRSLRIAHQYGIPHQISRFGEVRVLRSISHHSDVFVGGLLLETGRQQTVILYISHRVNQSCGHMAILVFKNGFVNLYFITAFDFSVVWFKTQWIGIVVVALYGAVGIQSSRFKHLLSVVVLNH